MTNSSGHGNRILGQRTCQQSINNMQSAKNMIKSAQSRMKGQPRTSDHPIKPRSKQDPGLVAAAFRLRPRRLKPAATKQEINRWLDGASIDVQKLIREGLSYVDPRI